MKRLSLVASTALSTILFGSSAAAQCEVAELRALETGPRLEGFGYEVSLSGDSAFVSWFHDESGPQGTGSIYVYERSEGRWRRSQRLLPRPGGHIGRFSVPSVSGDRAAVGLWGKSIRAGQVYFYERMASGWVRTQVVVPRDLEWDDEYGYSVDMDGRLAIVGSPKDDDASPHEPQFNSGSAYVYRRVKRGWTQVAKLMAADPIRDHYFGTSVAVSGDWLAVCTYDPLAVGHRGAVYVFAPRGKGLGTGGQILTASDGGIARLLRVAPRHGRRAHSGRCSKKLRQRGRVPLPTHGGGLDGDQIETLRWPAGRLVRILRLDPRRSACCRGAPQRRGRAQHRGLLHLPSQRCGLDSDGQDRAAGRSSTAMVRLLLLTRWGEPARGCTREPVDPQRLRIRARRRPAPRPAGVLFRSRLPVRQR